MNNSDLSVINSTVLKGGVTWNSSGPVDSPYRISIASDDYIMAGDASPTHAGVWRMDPNITTNQLFLGPVGRAMGWLRVFWGPFNPAFIGRTVAGGNAVLMDVDGDFPAVNGYNSLLIYNISSGPLPWKPLQRLRAPKLAVGVVSTSLGTRNRHGK